MGLPNDWDETFYTQSGFIEDVTTVAKHVHRRFLQATGTSTTTETTTAAESLPDNNPDKFSNNYRIEQERKAEAARKKKAEEEAA